MQLPEVSALGWIHSALCTVALTVGALQLARHKRSADHAIRGRVYFWSMVLANLTALFIFQADLVLKPGQPPLIGPYFGVFHWMAVFTLVLVLAGYAAAKRQHQAFNAYAHPILMILSYWLLVGGAINEAFARLEWVQQLALVVSPGAKELREYALLYWFQYANNAAALIALTMSIIAVRRFRSRADGSVYA
jgi:uncharacterized membrane protein